LLPRRPARHRLGQLFSTDREEFIAGLIAVVVPVQGVDGVSRAAIAVHAPVARMALADAVAQLPALRAAAARMRALR
jgi:IclR family acetate operon transcriptional repressor